MGFRQNVAILASKIATFGLKNFAHRPAANMPGKIALKIDPYIIAEQKSKLSQGSIVIVGTNGKTTITNMIADSLEAQGITIACNRTGANLAYGVASTLLHTHTKVQWGVFESDELWLAQILPQLRSKYVLLLNLFRDQLDRYGEIDRIQEAIINALNQSPKTTLIYNADDPLCATIAKRVNNNQITFGVNEDMHLAQNRISDTQMCHFCSSMFSYQYRQYGQLGLYTCNNCGFSRPFLYFYAHNIDFKNQITFDVTISNQDDKIISLHAPSSGPYMVYNVLAAYVACHILGVDDKIFQKSIDHFDPKNGRLQTIKIGNHNLLLNLAKNPTGFNQNLEIIKNSQSKKAVAFFINDNEADGHDISWIWDCDFEELSACQDLIVYAGGIRKNDLQLRLKYAGINAKLIDSIDEMVDEVLPLPSDWQLFVIANYTALPIVQQDLKNYKIKDKPLINEKQINTEQITNNKSGRGNEIFQKANNPYKDVEFIKPLKIVHLYPDLLNLYGDGGNVRVLEQRALWRGIPVEVVAINYGEKINLNDADIIVMGGGPDREQQLATTCLYEIQDDLKTYVEQGGVLIAICGGYQIAGSSWYMGDDVIAGLCLIDTKTIRPNSGFNRIIGNVAIKSPLATHPVIGYENHAGRTIVDKSEKVFGKVISNVGYGNDDTSKADGVIHKNMIATYLHGPLLGKNPEIADFLLSAALKNRFGMVEKLAPLDDKIELDANDYMAKRLGVVS